MSSNSYPILKHAFPKRVEALEALTQILSSGGDPVLLEKTAKALLDAARDLGVGQAAIAYRIYGLLTKALGHLTNWKHAVRNAEIDADRYLRSAKEITKEALTATPEGDANEPYRAAATAIEAVSKLEDVAECAERVIRIALPLPLLAHPQSDMLCREARRDSQQEPPRPEVFLEFSLDGQPFASPQVVSPGQLHDITLSVIVNNWPVAADQLLIHPTSVEQNDICKLPKFTLQKPTNLAHSENKFEERFHIDIHQSISARPLEYCYRADFILTMEPINAVVTGNARLEIYSYDPALNPVSGYREVDFKLLKIRDTLHKTILVDDRQLTDFLTVMTVLGRTVGKALQDAFFRGKWKEKRFQKHMKQLLRDEPKIGSALEEHPTAGGGITDLSFHQIRIELKVENKREVNLENACRYSNQTAQYVAGSDRRLGILCVLDCSPKKEAPGLVVNDIGVASVLTPKAAANTVPTTLGVVIIRGNLPVPSKI